MAKIDWRDNSGNAVCDEWQKRSLLSWALEIAAKCEENGEPEFTFTTSGDTLYLIHGDMIFETKLVRTGRRMDKEEAELCNPANYFFHVGPASKSDQETYKIQCQMVMVFIPYWEKNHHTQDKHLSQYLKSNLSGFSEEEESLFWSEMTESEARKVLLDRGFKENEAYSEFAETHDPFCFWDEDEDE